MNDSSPFLASSAGLVAERYRVADLEFFPAGDHFLLVYAKAHQRANFLRTDIVDLLMQCREFKTLEEHLQTFYAEQQSSAAPIRVMRRELQKLALSGYLIAQSKIFELSQEHAGQLSPQITSIGFPSCDRVEILQRGMSTYVENFQRFDRDLDFVVMDDSANPATRDAYLSMLRALKKQYGVRIAYAGLEEKVAFARKVAEVGNIPEEIVSFACVGDKQYGATTVGANRNALLLHTVGEVILSADDDTLCRIAPSPTLQEELALGSMENPQETWFFADRESALQSVRFVEQDFLALHGAWLGKSLQPYVAAWSREHELLLDQTEPELLQQLETREGKIVLSVIGTVGDCCWDNPHYHLFQSGNTFKRLTSSELSYRSARASREMAQMANRVTLVKRVDALFASCIGLDNRDLLPPFTPIGRAEDVGFGIMLSKCFEMADAVYIPWGVQHWPREARSYPTQHMFSIGFNSWLPSCISRFEPGYAGTPQERLRKLGQFLKEIASLPKTAFEELLRRFIWSSMSSLISLLDERLQNSSETLPAFWRQDAKAFITQARQSALTPIDQLYTLKGGQEQTQQVLMRLGQVLEWWPTMIETALRLRSEGYRLARQV